MSEVLVTNAAATGAVTIDITTGAVFAHTLTGNVTYTFTGSSTGAQYSFELWVTQDSTGGRSITWPAGVVWAQGDLPVMSTQPGALDVLGFETIDGGTTWIGYLGGSNFSAA